MSSAVSFDSDGDVTVRIRGDLCHALAEVLVTHCDHHQQITCIRELLNRVVDEWRDDTQFSDWERVLVKILRTAEADVRKAFTSGAI